MEFTEVADGDRLLIGTERGPDAPSASLNAFVWYVIERWCSKVLPVPRLVGLSEDPGTARCQAPAGRRGNTRYLQAAFDALAGCTLGQEVATPRRLTPAQNQLWSLARWWAHLCFSHQPAP